MLTLVSPTTSLHKSWLEAYREWGEGAQMDGAALRAEDRFEDPRDFARFVARLQSTADPAVVPPAGFVHATTLWIVEDDHDLGPQYLGSIDLRHSLTDYLLNFGGHIGYGVRPSARGRGAATWALGAILPVARELGIDRLLVTCDENNAASAAVIEKCGGVLEDTRNNGEVTFRRYWIDLSEDAVSPDARSAE